MHRAACFFKRANELHEQQSMQQQHPSIAGRGSMRPAGANAGGNAEATAAAAEAAAAAASTVTKALTDKEQSSMLPCIDL